MAATSPRWTSTTAERAAAHGRIAGTSSICRIGSMPCGHCRRNAWRLSWPGVHDVSSAQGAADPLLHCHAVGDWRDPDGELWVPELPFGAVARHFCCSTTKFLLRFVPARVLPPARTGADFQSRRRNRNEERPLSILGRMDEASGPTADIEAERSTRLGDAPDFRPRLGFLELWMGGAKNMPLAAAVH